jgi:very-short-patch-repair endonuclease
LAARQHGVVSLDQFRRLGLIASAVRSRIQRGTLHRVHSGVYAVGHPLLSEKGRVLAAVSACGPGAVLSHRSSADLWGIRPYRGRGVHVIVPGQAGRRRPGILPHRLPLHPAEVTELDAVPCTTVARTLLDLAEVVDRPGMERAIERSEQMRLFDLAGVELVIARAAGRPGARLLRDALRTDPPLTPHELQRRFLALCRVARLPIPATDHIVAGAERDFVWPLHRLVAETDGYSTHGTRRAMQRDRTRDRDLVRAGWRVVRFTWEDVVQRPGEVARELSELLKP